ncbi:MAG: ABC transporter substrate-binding protein [Azoarcus sp.]|jgi:NitT/TauT family transport system substrate-binding protein|nr:ABC transporter substrate-binding protein [Azoarcus sp.]
MNFPTLLYRAGLALALLSSVPVAQAESLKVGFMPIGSHVKFMIAQEQGYYVQEGLEVELIPFINSADGLTALTNHKIDVGSFGTSAPLLHIAKGSQIRIIGGITSGGSTFIARPEVAATIKSPADFRGRKIATVRLSTVDAVLRGALKDAGLDWKKDVQIFELKSAPAVTEAVKSGQVDIGATWGPHDLRAQAEGMKVLFYSDELYPAHVCCRLITNDRVDSATNVKLLRALLRAERFAAENREGTLDALAKYVKLDRPALEKDFYDPHKENSTDPYLKGLRQFWTIMSDSGFIDTTGKNIDDAVVLQDYESALQSLVKENPQDPYWQKLVLDFKTKNGA